MEEKTLKQIIIGHIESKDMTALKIEISMRESFEIAYVLVDLMPEEQVLVFRLLSKEKALIVFEQIDTPTQQQLLKSFTDKENEFIEEMEPDTRVKLLEELPASVAKRLISSLSAEERKLTNILLGYEPDTAGRIMTTKFISLRKKMTIQQALEKVKIQAKDKETVYVLYVTDDQKRLEGVISLRELIIADAEAAVEDIMNDTIAKVSTDTDQEEVANMLKDLDILALPVVDKEGCIVGIVTIDDAFDILEEEETEDRYKDAGIAIQENSRSDVLVNGSYLDIWKVRMPFLFITMVAGMLSGVVIEGFEETLESIAAVAIFIPLIMDMGGNVGTQSSTVFARGVALGHIHLKKFSKHFVKEMGIGLSIGVFTGVLCGIVAYLWQGIPELGLAVGLALVSTMTLASVLGFLVPYVLIKLNVDQAAGSAPIITSIKDIAGLLIYFVSVSVFMNAML